MTEFPHLPAVLAEALAAKGYAALTPVQEAVSQPELAGRDLLVSAQTGSGKTVAFGMAMAAELLGEGGISPFPDTPRALVVAPTRELAQQVSRELSWLYAKAGAVITGAVGGMDARAERRALERGAHIVVGTPGRICDHIRRGALDLSALSVVVLDEADEMLDMGFREDLEFILQAAPETRRTMMFSATVPAEIARLAATFQRDAQRISTIAHREQHADIDYRALLVDKSDRENAIVNLLRFHEAERAIVFCSTRAAVTHLTTKFLNRGLSVVALSGELSQDERSRALQMMRDGRARVCIATDVAARGIDLPGLELVIHADLPMNREGMLHRSGRTGRAGKKGISALVVPLNLRLKAERLLREAGVAATWEAAPGPEDILARDQERILAEPALTEPATAEEFEGISRLLEAFEPKQLAAAVLRHFRAARSAPEDLIAVSAEGGPKPRAREEFGASRFFRLSMGHDQYVDPKWLLPMICRAGDLTRRDIGMIRVFETETFVQIHASMADRFEGALRPAMVMEGKCTVTPLAEAPEGMDRPSPKPARWGNRDDDRGPKKPHRKGTAKPAYGDKPAYGEKPAYGDKPAYAAKPAYGEKPSYAPRSPRPPRDEAAAAPRPARKYDADAPAKPARPGYDPDAAPAPKGRKAAPWAREGGHGAAAEGKPKGSSPKPTAKFGKPAGKPAAKFGAKPVGKPGPKPGPKKPRAK